MRQKLTREQIMRNLVNCENQLSELNALGAQLDRQRKQVSKEHARVAKELWRAKDQLKRA